MQAKQRQSIKTFITIRHIFHFDSFQFPIMIVFKLHFDLVGVMNVKYFMMLEFSTDETIMSMRIPKEVANKCFQSRKDSNETFVNLAIWLLQMPDIPQSSSLLFFMMEKREHIFDEFAREMRISFLGFG